MSLHRRDGGSAMVELALALPVLLLLLLGILDMGRALNAYVTVRNASAEGAHWAALHPAAAQSEIEGTVRGRITSFDASLVTVRAQIEDGAGWRAWPAEGIPQAARARVVPILVDVSYPWNAITFIGRFFPGGSATFTSRATADALR